MVASSKERKNPEEQEHDRNVLLEDPGPPENPVLRVTRVLLCLPLAVVRAVLFPICLSTVPADLQSRLSESLAQAEKHFAGRSFTLSASQIESLAGI